MSSCSGKSESTTGIAAAGAGGAPAAGGATGFAGSSSGGSGLAGSSSGGSALGGGPAIAGASGQAGASSTGGGASNLPDLTPTTEYDGVDPITVNWNDPGGSNATALAAELIWASPEPQKSLNGPIWLAHDHLLIFTDAPNGKILQLDQSGQVSTWGNFPSGPNGLALESNDALIACEITAKRIARIDLTTKTETVIVDNIDGAPFAGPVECDVAQDGTIYFVDHGDAAPRPIYAVKNGKAKLLTNLNWEVAVHLSLGQDLLFSPADWPGHTVTALPLLSDGTVGERIRWSDMRREGGAGMCLDKGSNLFVSGIEGIEVFKHTDHSWFGFVVMDDKGGPGYDHPNNCTFGDDDGKTIYITRPQALMKARVNIPGLPD